MKRICLLLILLTVAASSQAQLTVNNAVTPTQLVNNILLGSGVTASNITFTGVSTQRSSFNCSGSCNLNMSTGVLLSTGHATSPTAPASYFHSDDVGGGGDPQLNLIVSPLLTQDAAILEFDFAVSSDSVKFEYVFSSEEYNDYVNTPFNDVFAFYISGPGFAGPTNIALLPGTSTPVSINNVNFGGPYGGVASGPCVNCSSYVDNVGGSSVYFDGFTTVLRAQAAVQPCQTLPYQA